MRTEFKLHASSADKIFGVKGLGKTGETYLNDWMKERVFGRKKEFDSKYFEKGNFCEQDALDFSAKILGFEHSYKNDEYFEDEHFCGTPDLILEKDGLIVDIKNSWDCFTFPLFEEEIPNQGYYLQLQIYMHLTGYRKAKLVYCLMDAPNDLINKEAKRQAWASGLMGFANEDILGHVKQRMIYSNMPDKLRIKSFDISYDEKVIDKLKGRVNECKQYVKSNIIFKSFINQQSCQK